MRPIEGQHPPGLIFKQAMFSQPGLPALTLTAAVYANPKARVSHHNIRVLNILRNVPSRSRVEGVVCGEDRQDRVTAGVGPGHYFYALRTVYALRSGHHGDVMYNGIHV